MLVSVKEYASAKGKSASSVRRMCRSSRFITAQQIGRDWVIDKDEPYPERANACKTFKVVSLFSGCGGMDLGFLGDFDFLGKHYSRNPYKIIWANEISPAACLTYSQNVSKDIICGDVAEVLGSLPENADVVIGGFPCQDISINGKMRGLKGERSSLYTYMIEAIKKTDPKAFIAENVEALMMKKHEKDLQKIVSDFEKLGYTVTVNVYKAEDYGVPQTRHRVIIAGLKSGLFVPPKAPTQKKPVTAKQAIGDLEDVPENKEFSHIWSRAKVSGEQGNRHLLADRPCYTIRAECHGNTQWHYSLPRRMSMREEARAQSFPDSFRFPCGLRETERQIGNAVPPVLAWHVAKSLSHCMRSMDEER